ncbi:vWA domain-containing protein [Actinophytocola oryzae]|uniref:von Willebrand factor type A domain-containing protein n=1 Tax=Actinophytocola oryzae TaxID=502181 RepID=A0A4R7UQB2_9PSEU|nr:VWA domain-containing protein [Actinophytocola oryzae]TDV34884.1 von Willebrand factor type A domain-containing protein [Actinophytocola oryzae]
MTQPDFAVEVYQNEYLAAGATEVNAIVTVTASGAVTGPVASGGNAAEVIIVDCSGSMHVPRTKLSSAKQATAAAIDTLRDGVEFAVVAGTDEARLVFPYQHGMVVSSPQTRAEAKEAVAKLAANGGTAIGRWLSLADSLFATSTASMRHAILLTDGQNMHETPRQLARTLQEVTGHFVCDCRGVGTDWEVKELRTIADTLLGTVDIVAEPEGLEADFRAMAASAMDKAVADVALRLWTPMGATIKYVKQVEPTLNDLTARRVEVPPRSGDYPTGSWGSETRDYHVCVQVPAAATGEKMLAGRVSLVVPGTNGAEEQVLGKGRILAVWTEDTALSTRINREVAHYTGQAELADVIQEGLEARKAGDVETATAKLGRAVQLATETGHSDTAKLLAKVVDVEDARTGTVRLKRSVAAVDEMTLDTRSSKTMRVRKKQSTEADG